MIKSLVAVLVVGGWLVATPAEAAVIYVDNSCAIDGDGTAVACATSAGGPGAHRDLQPALTRAMPDDVVTVRAGAGTYVTTNGVGYTDPTGFFFGNSGTPGHPITLTGYLDERPLLAGCADGETSSAACGRNTLSIHQRSYIHVTRIRVRGAINSRCDVTTLATLCAGLELDHLEITQGWSSPDDGNWSGIWLSATTGAHVHHNFIHDIAPLAGAGTQSSAACIKIYTGVKSVYEFNTCDTVAFAESQSGCFDDKQDAYDNVWRYNHCVNANGGIRLQNQNGPYEGVPPDATNVRIYQNVFVMGTAAGPRDGVRFEAAGFDGIDIYNNTFVGFANCFEVHAQDDGQTVRNVRTYNNLCAGITAAHMHAFEPAYVPAIYDYNVDDVATPSPQYMLGGANHATLADLVSSTPFGDGSRALALADIGFAIGGTDSLPYHLPPSSAALGAGRVGGVATGAVIDPGAYVDGITCVGHQCADLPPMTGDAGVGGDDASTMNPGDGDGHGCGCAVRGGRGDLPTVALVVWVFASRRRRRPTRACN